jgi:hypothetical protein
MSSLIKTLKPFVPKVILTPLRHLKEKQQLKDWQAAGCPSPPPHIVKQLLIDEFRKKNSIATLVETGTYLGDMIEAQKKRFAKIISIELSVELHKNAQKRFQNDKNVVIEQGDSGKVLPRVMAALNEPAIFWLDGHFSSGVTAKGDKDCPIFEELDAIFAANKLNHVLLIDDARFFNGEGDYPTIEALSAYIKNKNSAYCIEVKHDVIRCFV